MLLFADYDGIMFYSACSRSCLKGSHETFTSIAPGVTAAGGTTEALRAALNGPFPVPPRPDGRAVSPH